MPTSLASVKYSHICCCSQVSCSPKFANEIFEDENFTISQLATKILNITFLKNFYVYGISSFNFISLDYVLDGLFKSWSLLTSVHIRICQSPSKLRTECLYFYSQVFKVNRHTCTYLVNGLPHPSVYELTNW